MHRWSSFYFGMCHISYRAGTSILVMGTLIFITQRSPYNHWNICTLSNRDTVKTWQVVTCCKLLQHHGREKRYFYIFYSVLEKKKLKSQLCALELNFREGNMAWMKNIKLQARVRVGKHSNSNKTCFPSVTQQGINEKIMSSINGHMYIYSPKFISKHREILLQACVRHLVITIYTCLKLATVGQT